MAERLVTYPKAQPLQFVKLQNGPEGNSFKWWDEWWACERKQPWEQKVSYYQKVQQDDEITIVFHSNNGGTAGATVKVYDQDWNYVDEIATATIAVSGYEITSEQSGTTYTAQTHLAEGNWSGFTEGFYYMVLEVPFASGDPVKMISEPIWVRQEHPRTKRLKYRHSTNKEDIFYKEHDITFYLRLECNLYNPTVNSLDTQYEDETVDITSTDSVPYNTYTFGTRHVPFWMANKVNRAFSTDTIQYEERYITKDKDAKFEQSKNPNSGYTALSISVREARNLYSQQVVDIEPILVWQILNNGDSGGSTRFRYFVHTARLLRSGASTVNLMIDLNGADGAFPYSKHCKEVRDEADELVLLNHANNVTRAQYNQLGYYDFVVTGGDAAMYYYPHPSEQNYTGATRVVLSRHTLFGYDTNGWVAGQFCDVKGSYIGYALVNQIGAHFSGKYGNGNPSITYVVGGSAVNIANDESRLYHYNQATSGNTITEIRAIYEAQTPNFKQISLRAPTGLTHLKIRSGVAGYFYFFDWAYLEDANNTIFSVDLSFNQIQSIDGMTPLFDNGELAALQYYDVQVNELPVSEIDKLFNDMYVTGAGTQVYALTGGEVWTKGQTPAAPPTAASAVARNQIDVIDSWVVMTD